LNGFQIDGEQEGKKEGHVRKSFVFYARNVADRELWAGKIKKAIGKRTIARAEQKKEKEKAKEDAEGKEREKLGEVERLKHKVDKQRKLIESLKEFMESEFEEKKSMLADIERLKQADIDKELEIKRLRDELAARDRLLSEAEERAKAAVAEAEERAKATAAKTNGGQPEAVIAVPPRPRGSMIRTAEKAAPQPPPANLDDDAEKRGSMAFFQSMSQGVGRLLEIEKVKFEAERKEREEREKKEKEEREGLVDQEIRTRAIRADSILVEDEWIQKKTRLLSLEKILDSDDDDEDSTSSSASDKGGKQGEATEEVNDDDDDDEADDEEEDGVIKKFYEADTEDEVEKAKKDEASTASTKQHEQQAATEEVNLFNFIAEQVEEDKKDSKYRKKRFTTPSKIWPFGSRKSHTSSSTPGASLSPSPSPSTTSPTPPSTTHSPSPSPPPSGSMIGASTSSHGVSTRVPPPVPARTPSVHLSSVTLSPTSSQEAFPTHKSATAPTASSAASANDHNGDTSSGEEDSEGEGDAELGDHMKALRESNPDFTTRRTRASIMLFFGNTK
jgi:hypothetical protein